MTYEQASAEVAEEIQGLKDQIATYLTIRAKYGPGTPQAKVINRRVRSARELLKNAINGQRTRILVKQGINPFR